MQKTLKRVLSLVLVAVVIVSSFGLMPAERAKAATTYLVKVNKQENCVTVYKLDENGKYQPVKAMVCSTGYATESGTYSMGEKLRWHTLDGPCYGQYCARIYGGVLFHSVWYYNPSDPSSLSVNSYNLLGTTASHGCVRLTCADAKWLYDNVPVGSTVEIYASSNPGPLGKPRAIKVPASCSWDPTDIWSTGNPWNSKKPKISGAKNQTVAYGSTFDVMSGISATNTTGYDCKDLVKTVIRYNGSKVKKVNTNNPGVYKVKYTLKDEIGRKAKPLKAKIKVTASEPTPIISDTETLYVKKKSKITKGFIYKNISVTQSGKVLEKKYISIKVKKDAKGEFTVIVTAQNASAPVTAKIKVYVDKEKPQILGVIKDQVSYVASVGAVTESYAKSFINVSDNIATLTNDDVKVVIKQESATKVKVRYILADWAGNKRKVRVYFDTQAPATTPTPVQVTTPSATTQSSVS